MFPLSRALNHNPSPSSLLHADVLEEWSPVTRVGFSHSLDEPCDEVRGDFGAACWSWVDATISRSTAARRLSLSFTAICTSLRTVSEWRSICRLNRPCESASAIASLPVRAQVSAMVARPLPLFWKPGGFIAPVSPLLLSTVELCETRRMDVALPGEMFPSLRFGVCVKLLSDLDDDL